MRHLSFEALAQKIGVAHRQAQRIAKAHRCLVLKFYGHGSRVCVSDEVLNAIKSLDLIKRQSDAFLPADIKGKSVLDIGAWSGAFSFEAERRGASRVVASDHFCWIDQFKHKSSFDFAKKALNSNVEEYISTVDDLSPKAVGTFDIVLFLGVLYHLRHPFLGLERAAAMSHDTLVVDTETALDTLDRPAMAFFPGTELNNDPTNWWAPNIACAKGMLMDLGFRHVDVTKNPNPALKHDGQRGRHIFTARR